MVKIAMDLLEEGIIDEKAALLRIEPNKLDELLHPVFDPKAFKEAHVIAQDSYIVTLGITPTFPSVGFGYRSERTIY